MMVLKLDFIWWFGHALGVNFPIILVALSQAMGLCDPYLPDSLCIQILLYDIVQVGLLMKWEGIYSYNLLCTETSESPTTEP